MAGVAVSAGRPQPGGGRGMSYPQIDRCRGRNLASSDITTKICVSTAGFPWVDASCLCWPDGSPGGERCECGRARLSVFETWIFSDDPRQKSRQIPHRTEREALAAHSSIATNLRVKYALSPTPPPEEQA